MNSRSTTIRPTDLANPDVLRRWGRVFLLVNHFGPLAPALVGRTVHEQAGILTLEDLMRE